MINPAELEPYGTRPQVAADAPVPRPSDGGDDRQASAVLVIVPILRPRAGLVDDLARATR
jgi:hypothetical protein